MKIASRLHDARIEAENLLLEVTVKEYEELVNDVLEKNEFQRRRVRSSKTVYALLREDLLRGCVIPPIVLALTDENVTGLDDDNIGDALKASKDHLVILDGLQRTHTIFDLLKELRASGDEDKLKFVEDIVLRVEIYVGLNRVGILYRMLTLNTGQTPMSLRQQTEILYLDYLSVDVDNIELIRETDGKLAAGDASYNFKNVIEGFNSYLCRDELPIDKADILDNISSLEKLSKENQSTDLFKNYLVAMHRMVTKIVLLCDGAEVDPDQFEESIFGKKAVQVFKKPQAMSGFGAAVGKMIDFEIISNIDDVLDIIESLEIDDENEFLYEINTALAYIKNNSKKIGNAQRNFFTFFFRELLNKESDSYEDLLGASKTALRKYQAQNM